MSDRVALANAIEDAGIARDKAQRVASVIFDAIHDKVATKADVQASEAALTSELQALRHDVQGSGAATRADIAAGMAELKSDVVAPHLPVRLPALIRGSSGRMPTSSRWIAHLQPPRRADGGTLRYRHRSAALLATVLVIQA